MAQAKAKPNTGRASTAHKSVVSNPGGRKYHVGGGRKKTTRSHSTGKGRSNSNRRNPGTAMTKTTTRKTYRRNPSPTTNAALFAIGGALVVYGFDLLVGKLAPSISTPLRIGGAVAAGYAVGKWGKKYIGSWADIAQAASWFKAAWDGWNSYLAPTVNNFLGVGSGLAVVATQQIPAPTGQMGMRFFLNDGNVADMFQDAPAMAY